MLVFALPVFVFAFVEDEAKAPAPAEIVRKQLQDAIKLFEDKKETYQKDVLDLFEKKEKDFRDKGDLKLLNLIKQEKDAFIKNGKAPTLFFISDQKRYLELAKLDLITSYEKTIKDCIKMKLDLEAEKYSQELKEIRMGKIKVEEKKAKPIFLEAPFNTGDAKNAQTELAKRMGKVVEPKIDLGRGVKLEMVLIPAGKFMMGSPASEPGRQINENQHEVTLTKPFYIGKYEVTQEQWQTVMGINPSSRTKGAKLPVTYISWLDCQEYIKKLNSSTKGSYRLPTEAEWEYACRAGANTAYSFGDSLTKNDANYGEPKGGSIKPVGSYKMNAFGLHDMHSNVMEWCEDWHAEYLGVSAIDPMGPLAGTYRVARGGAYHSYDFAARSSYRGMYAPSGRARGVGFRLARTI